MLKGKNSIQCIPEIRVLFKNKSLEETMARRPLMLARANHALAQFKKSQGGHQQCMGVAAHLSSTTNSRAQFIYAPTVDAALTDLESMEQPKSALHQGNELQIVKNLCTAQGILFDWSWNKVSPRSPPPPSRA